MTAAEVREAKLIDEREAKLKTKKDAAKLGLDQLENVERNLNVLFDPKTKKLTPAADALFGKFAQYRPDMLQTQESVDADAALTSLKDQIMMSNLADAKKAVGQSFGSMQVQEWDKFVRQLAALDRKMGSKTAAANMSYIRDFITNKREILNAALSAQPDNSPTTPPSGGSKELTFRTPNEVKAAFKSGSISRENAKIILKDMGMGE
jgi:hypothetical protein